MMNFRPILHLKFEAFERHPFLALLGDRAEMESLVRHVGPERFEQERVKDAEFFAGLISSWQREGLVDPGANPLAVAAVSRAVLALIQGRDLIGEDWDDLVELTIDALATRLATGLATPPSKKSRAR